MLVTLLYHFCQAHHKVLFSFTLSTLNSEFPSYLMSLMTITCKMAFQWCLASSRQSKTPSTKYRVKQVFQCCWMTLHTVEQHLDTGWHFGVAMLLSTVMGSFFYWKNEHFSPGIFPLLRSYRCLTLGCATSAFWTRKDIFEDNIAVSAPMMLWFMPCVSRHNLHFLAIKLQQVKSCIPRLYLKYLRQIHFAEALQPKWNKHPEHAYNVDIRCSAAAIALYRSTLTGPHFLLTNNELFGFILTDKIKLKKKTPEGSKWKQW